MPQTNKRPASDLENWRQASRFFGGNINVFISSFDAVCADLCGATFKDLTSEQISRTRETHFHNLLDLLWSNETYNLLDHEEDIEDQRSAEKTEAYRSKFFNASSVIELSEVIDGIANDAWRDYLKIESNSDSAEDIDLDDLNEYEKDLLKSPKQEVDKWKNELIMLFRAEKLKDLNSLDVLENKDRDSKRRRI